MITLQEIKQNESIKALVRAGNRYLETLGYTDHGPRHLGYVSRTGQRHFEKPGIQRARGGTGPPSPAGYTTWATASTATITAQTALFCSFPCLREIGMDIEDVMIIITAVGNHEEQSGTVSSAVSAALAIAR